MGLCTHQSCWLTILKAPPPTSLCKPSSLGSLCVSVLERLYWFEDEHKLEKKQNDTGQIRNGDGSHVCELLHDTLASLIACFFVFF